MQKEFEKEFCGVAVVLAGVCCVLCVVCCLVCVVWCVVCAVCGVWCMESVCCVVCVCCVCCGVVCDNSSKRFMVTPVVYPRVFEFVPSLTTGTLRKNHIVSTTFGAITKTKKKRISRQRQ